MNKRDWLLDWKTCQEMIIESMPAPLVILGPIATEHGREWEIATAGGKGIWVARCQNLNHARAIVVACEALPYWLQRVRKLEAVANAAKVLAKWMQWWLDENLCDCDGIHICGRIQREQELNKFKRALAELEE